MEGAGVGADASDGDVTTGDKGGEVCGGVHGSCDGDVLGGNDRALTRDLACDGDVSAHKEKSVFKLEVTDEDVARCHIAALHLVHTWAVDQGRFSFDLGVVVGGSLSDVEFGEGLAGEPVAFDLGPTREHDLSYRLGTAFHFGAAGENDSLSLPVGKKVAFEALFVAAQRCQILDGIDLDVVTFDLAIRGDAPGEAVLHDHKFAHTLLPA